MADKNEEVILQKIRDGLTREQAVEVIAAQEAEDESRKQPTKGKAKETDPGK